jgi:hypothetical protein
VGEATTQTDCRGKLWMPLLLRAPLDEQSSVIGAAVLLQGSVPMSAHESDFLERIALKLHGAGDACNID